MPTFRYRAYGPLGELAEGRIEADSSDAASETLWNRGLTAFQLDPVGSSAAPWWRRELFAKEGVSLAGLASFTREFATLASAEIPLDDTLRVLSDQTSSKGGGELATRLLVEVMSGSALSDAMAKHPHVFPTDYVNVVRAGEIGGSVSEVLTELAGLLEKRVEVRARVRSALIYPSILIVMSFVSLGIIVGALIPSIAPVFTESGKPMPMAIGFLVAVQSRWIEIALALSVIGLTSAAVLSIAVRKPAMRVALDRRKLALPLIGAFVLQQETAQFARTLGTLLKAGVPLLQAISSARSAIANRYIDMGVGSAIEAIRQGSALHDALRRETPLPTVALRMISVGEESGRLGKMLLHVAALFEQQIQRGMERFMTILTPLLTVSIAVLVGGLILAVMNAILSINDLAVR